VAANAAMPQAAMRAGDFRDQFRAATITERVTKMQKPKRGRPPIGRKAMTAAQRQAKRRAKLRQEAKLAKERRDGRPAAYQPPHGYNPAKQKLQVEGHVFERARREAGFEEGVFVDGAFVGSREVITMAAMPKKERERFLDQERRRGKDFAVSAVAHYMDVMRVSVDELLADERTSSHPRGGPAPVRMGARIVPAQVPLFSGRSAEARPPPQAEREP
jgi:hypothetical protein